MSDGTERATIAGPSGDMLAEYDGDARVFRIEDEDGEVHWYVAENAAHALTEHLGLMEPESDAFEIDSLSPDEVIRVHGDDMRDFARFPAHWLRSTFDDRGPEIEATAGEWAAFYADTKQPAVQICSTCF